MNTWFKICLRKNWDTWKITENGQKVLNISNKWCYKLTNSLGISLNSNWDYYCPCEWPKIKRFHLQHYILQVFITFWPFSVFFQVSQLLLRHILNHVFICNNFYHCNIAIRGYLKPSQFYWDTFWNFFASHLSFHTVWERCFECFVE